MSICRPLRPPDIEAVVGALSTAAGGRATPMISGYRPSHDFGLPDEVSDGMHEYLDGDCIAPGASGRALLWLLVPERQTARLFAGMIFPIQEGSRVVGSGRIVRVPNERLLRPSPVTFEIDGTLISSLEDFYEEISRVLIPKADWGRNLDAFNDVLRGGFGTPDEGFRLVWRTHSQSQERLGYAETVRQLEHRLARCHPANRRHVAADLKRARDGVGPTVYDWLLEIIHDHGPDGSESSDCVDLVLD